LRGGAAGIYEIMLNRPNLPARSFAFAVLPFSVPDENVLRLTPH
jgi:hypothetical protein